METIGEVRFGPIMTIFAISMRMNAGKPASAGAPFLQISPGAQSMASTGAQIKTFDPSKSPAEASPGAEECDEQNNNRE